MSIQHHIHGDLLLAYCAATLDEGASILVATHLALCSDCRSDAEIVETLGGIFLENATTNQKQEKSDQKIFASIIKSHQSTASTSSKSSLDSFVFPEPLRSYIGGDPDELDWQPVGGGIRQFLIKTHDSQTTARLLMIPAGKRVPDHGHQGFEATLVLSGSFYDRDSWYRRGDVSIADSTVIHHPAAGPEEDCICLAVTDAKLKFRSPLPRLFQKFHGI